MTKVRNYKIKALFAALLVIGAIFVVMGLHKPQPVKAATVKKTATTKYPYLIKVNKLMNTVTIYKKDAKGKYTVPVKAMVCSTGKYTPIGTYRTKAKYRWRILFGNVYGQYATRITGHILFHSVYYYKKNPATLSAKEFNKLGTSASMGCIRLQVADTKWIYDNCGIGTTVVIYNSKNPGPLGKPKAVKVSSKTKWDPTDTTNKSNPLNKKKPVITGVKNITIAYGSTYSPRKGLKAYNTCGVNITKYVKVKSNVNTKVAGTYKVIYTVTDALKRTTTKAIKVAVKPREGMPVLTGVTDKLYSYEDYKALDISSYVLNGVKANVKGQILGKEYLKYSVNKILDNSDVTQYAVTYIVTNGKYKTKKIAYIYLDKKAPVITGVQDLEVTMEEFLNLKVQLEQKNYVGITFMDNCTPTEKLVISTELIPLDENNYQVIYTVKDEVGYVTTMSSHIHIIVSTQQTSIN